MKRNAIVLAVSLMATGPSIAQTATATGTGVGVANSRSQSAATAIGGGNATGGNAVANSAGGHSQATINSNAAAIPANTSASITTVPNAYAPGLTAAGLETCLGSVSGGGSALGWGAVFGTTIQDPGCAARLDARTLWSFGLKKAAIARLCLMNDVYRSMPEVCVQYLPQQPGYVAASAEPLPYTGGPVEVVMRGSGQHRMCAEFDEIRHRCRVWARN